MPLRIHALRDNSLSHNNPPLPWRLLSVTCDLNVNSGAQDLKGNLSASQNEDCDVATFGSGFRNTPEDVSEDDGHVWLPIDVARVVPGEARRGQGRPKAGDVR